MFDNLKKFVMLKVNLNKYKFYYIIYTYIKRRKTIHVSKIFDNLERFVMLKGNLHKLKVYYIILFENI